MILLNVVSHFTEKNIFLISKRLLPMVLVARHMNACLPAVNENTLLKQISLSLQSHHGGVFRELLKMTCTVTIRDNLICAIINFIFLLSVSSV